MSDTTFTFYLDKKITIWKRESHEIEASSLAEASEKMKKYFHEDLCENADTFVEEESIYETLEYLNPSDNLGMPTVELYDEDMNLIANNTKNMDE